VVARIDTVSAFLVDVGDRARERRQLAEEEEQQLGKGAGGEGGGGGGGFFSGMARSLGVKGSPVRESNRCMKGARVVV
jgi:hypothetical protein